MLKLPNFDHIYNIIESRDKILLLTSLAEIMDVITFISKFLYFKVANFADIIKIAAMFIKTTFKDSKKS